MAPIEHDYLSKDDLFAVLASMKVTLPRTSKMSVEDLGRRLRDAFNTSQRMEDLLGDVSLDPRELSSWAGVELMNQIGVMQQSLKDNFERLESQGVPKTLQQRREETMRQMQDLVLWLGYQSLQGTQNVFFSDDKIEDWAIAIRIHGVYAMNKDTPIFILSYRTVSSIPDKTLEQQLNEIFPSQGRAGQKTDTLARQAFLRLLQLNSKKVVSGYEPAGAENKRFVKKKWKLSFVLPLGPLPMAKVGKLTDDPGCDVCGSTSNTNRCTQCLSAVYCGPGCQKADWSNHKHACKVLGGGTWTTIDLGDNPSPPGMPGIGGFMQAMNVNESWSNLSSNQAQKIPSKIPNVHGTKAFLVKFQTSIMGRGRMDHMLLYDRQRSFTVAWKPSGDPVAFAVGEAEMMRQPIPKMYRWAKFTGPRTMSVCFDRAPQDMPPW